MAPTQLSLGHKSELQHRLEMAATLSATIQSLEAQLQEHRQWFTEYLQNQPESHIEHGNFCVILKSRHNWTYSSDLQIQITDLKRQQKYEQDHDIAIDNPKSFVAFTFKPVK